MNFRGIKNTVLVLAVAGTFLVPSVKAEAAELSDLVSAGVTTTMEQVEDVTVLEAATSPSVVEGYTLLGVVNAEKGILTFVKSRVQTVTWLVRLEKMQSAKLFLLKMNGVKLNPARSKVTSAANIF